MHEISGIPTANTFQPHDHIGPQKQYYFTSVFFYEAYYTFKDFDISYWIKLQILH